MIMKMGKTKFKETYFFEHKKIWQYLCTYETENIGKFEYVLARFSFPYIVILIFKSKPGFCM